MVALIAMIALLGVGAITMLTVRSDSAASGQDRFHQMSLYAAESGAALAMDFLRNQCDASALYTQFVTRNNETPMSPPQIAGNGKLPGELGNPFGAVPDTWYELQILNNADDTGFSQGLDEDGILILRAIGHGPNQSSAILELELSSPELCLDKFCESAYAQENVNAQNDTVAACAQLIDVSGGLRVANPGS